MEKEIAKEIAAFEAKCLDCGQLFDFPDLGEFSYGEFIFFGKNGNIFAYCNAFSVTSKLIEVLLPENCGPDLYQSALAELADPIEGQKLTTSLVCPRCNSTNIECRMNKKTGSAWVKLVTYHNLLSLRRNNLIKRIQDFATTFEWP